MRVLSEHIKEIAAAVVALGVIATGVIQLADVRENACDALLWTIQRDLFAARQMQTQATELAPSLSESAAIIMNRQVLKSARESIEKFEQKRALEKKECGRD